MDYKVDGQTVRLFARQKDHSFCQQILRGAQNDIGDRLTA